MLNFEPPFSLVVAFTFPDKPGFLSAHHREEGPASQLLSVVMRSHHSVTLPTRHESSREINEMRVVAITGVSSKVTDAGVTQLGLGIASRSKKTKKTKTNLSHKRGKE